MRNELAEIEDFRGTFIGTFARFGTKSGYRGPEPTLLLKDVRDGQDKLMTDHLWFNLTKGFGALGLLEGDIVRFDARVKWYLKGYLGRREDVWDAPVEEDYKLSHPTRVELVLRVAGGPPDE